jgi:L-ascorbate metabolism protein UlaG (beta-lactamase superfamily)
MTQPGFPLGATRREFLATGGTSLLAATASAAVNPPDDRRAHSVPGVDDAQQPSSKLKIQRLAWAGIRIECGSTTLFVDAHNDPDYGAANIPLSSTTDLSYALVTHHHGDHCDPVALKPVLGANGRLVCHRDVALWFDPHGLQIQTVETEQTVFFSRSSGDLAARAVPAVDGIGHPQFSWVIDGGHKRIIHCGDTLWHGYWWDISRAYGPFDVAFLPINGFQQAVGRYTASGIPMSLTPEQAASAASILGVSLVVPIHYGNTGDKDYVEVLDPEASFIRAAAARHLLVKILSPGEILEL